MDFVFTALSLAITAIPFLVAVLLPFILLSYMLMLYQSPLVGAFSVLIYFVIETWTVFSFALNLGLTVYPQDILFVPMAAVTFFRLLRRGAVSRLPRSLWLLAAMMMMSFVVGLAVNGTTAGVEFRNDFYSLTSLFYFSSFSWDEKRVSRLARGFCVTALFIVAIVAFRWLTDAFDLDWVTPLWRYADSTGVPLRVVNAQVTLELAFTLILLVFAMAAGATLDVWLMLVPVAALVILVLQHRSVWVSAYLPALMALVISGKNKEKLHLRLAAMAVVTAVVVVPLLATGKFSSATSSVSDLAVKATSTTGGTFVNRVEGWDLLMRGFTSSGPRTWLIGNPYGSGFMRDIGPGGSEIATAPHDYFVQLLLRTGVIGILAYLSLFRFLFKGALRLGDGPHRYLNGHAMIGLLVSILLFNIPYSMTFLAAMLMGVFLSLQLQYAAQAKSQENAVKEPPRSPGNMRIPLQPSKRFRP